MTSSHLFLGGCFFLWHVRDRSNTVIFHSTSTSGQNSLQMAGRKEKTMALYVFKSAVRMSNGPKDVLKAVGNRVGALMAEPGEPATFRIGPLTFQTSIVRRIFAAYGQVKVVTDDNYYIFK